MAALFDLFTPDQRQLYMLWGGGAAGGWLVVKFSGQKSGDAIPGILIPDADVVANLVVLVAAPPGAPELGSLVVWNPNIQRIAVPAFTPNPNGGFVRGSIIGRIWQYVTIPFVLSTLAVIECVDDDSWAIVSQTEIEPAIPGS